MDQVLFSRLRTNNSPQSDAPDCRLPWLIMKRITENTYLKFFNKVIMLWSQSDFKKYV